MSKMAGWIDEQLKVTVDEPFCTIGAVLLVP
jgi:hypothetical protein